MGRKPAKITEFETFLSKNPQVLEQFKNFDGNAITQPSILVKGGIQTIDIKRIPPKQIEQYLILHPVIPRGVEIKANRITSRGYKILPKNNSRVAKEAATRCENLIRSSGGEILLNSWIRDAYAFGNGYMTLLKNSDGEIVYISKEHPVFFRIAREKLGKASKYSSEIYAFNIAGDFGPEWGAMKIDPATKKPLAYTQVNFLGADKNVVEPVGEEISSSRVAHLVFFTWGDEAEGVGIVQYVHNMLKYLMNIEEAGAEAIFRAGFTQKKVTTEINTEKELKQLAKNLNSINSSDAIILPRGTDVENLIPGSSDFPDVHDVFLNLIAVRLGVPKPILTLDVSDINKATMQELMKDLIYDLHADELRISQTIEESIFRNACENWYGEDFDLIPMIKFNDFEEGREEKAMVLNLTADYIKKLSESYKLMVEMNQPDAAKRIAEFMIANIPFDKDSPQVVEATSLIVEPEKPEPKIMNNLFQPKTPLVDTESKPVDDKV